MQLRDHRRDAVERRGSAVRRTARGRAPRHHVRRRQCARVELVDQRAQGCERVLVGRCERLEAALRRHQQARFARIGEKRHRRRGARSDDRGETRQRRDREIDHVGDPRREYAPGAASQSSDVELGHHRATGSRRYPPGQLQPFFAERSPAEQQQTRTGAAELPCGRRDGLRRHWRTAACRREPRGQPSSVAARRDAPSSPSCARRTPRARRPARALVTSVATSPHAVSAGRISVAIRPGSVLRFDDRSRAVLGHRVRAGAGAHPVRHRARDALRCPRRAARRARRGNWHDRRRR